MSTVYDVIVVGTGPAGGAAAYHLGEAGRRVLVLERERLPRPKPCGGMLSEHLLRRFPFSFEPVIEGRVEAFAYALDGRTEVVPRPGQTMCCVMRDRFDYHLLSQARAEVRDGAAVQAVEEDEAAVTVHTRGGLSFTGRYLVGADGANSAVARSLGLDGDDRTAVALAAEVRAAPEVTAAFAGTPLFIFGAAPGGYAWVFPKRDHLSVGIGSFWPHPRGLRPRLEQALASYGISLDGSRPRGHPLPTGGRGRLATGRVLLAGDAAGLVDPLSGEGIRQALKSGRLAAEAILGGAIEAYPAEVRRRVLRGRGYNRLLAWFFYHLPRLSYFLTVRNHRGSRLLAEVLADTSDYARLFPRFLASLPPHLAREGLAALSRQEARTPRR